MNWPAIKAKEGFVPFTYTVDTSFELFLGCEAFIKKIKDNLRIFSLALMDQLLFGVHLFNAILHYYLGFMFNDKKYFRFFLVKHP